MFAFREVGCWRLESPENYEFFVHNSNRRSLLPPGVTRCLFSVTPSAIDPNCAIVRGYSIMPIPYNPERGNVFVA